MRIVLVTHAEASDVAPRLLTADGVMAAGMLAGRIERIMGASWRVNKAVSSPAVRCIQTALVMLGTLAGEKLRRLDTDPRLMAAADPMESDQLFGALADYSCEGLLAILHADLANALPGDFKPLGAGDGWFDRRPVVCVLDWETGRPNSECRILLLEGPEGESLLPPEYAQAPDTKLLLT